MTEREEVIAWAERYADGGETQTWVPSSICEAIIRLLKPPVLTDEVLNEEIDRTDSWQEYKDIR